jgi:hypothetical protein
MTKPGIDADGIAKTEADHSHIHDAEIEISEGPEPSPRQGPR